jgi:TolB-like protein/DNA-binding winged helix-turn-helix (wHTH) protein/Tfp pilus assembly protein PilF
MNDQPEPIRLAAAPDFALGALHIHPSLRRISAGGNEELVEPRVMQALIALAEAGGAVVSRDTLIDRCWGGRIVGEDAINRCIAKVRRLAETTVPPAFCIDTVAKVGYRLRRAGGTAEADDAPLQLAAPASAEPFREPRGRPAIQARGWLLAFAGRLVIEDGRGDRPALPWRAAGWTGAAVIALAGVAVLAWPPTARVATPLAVTAPFNPPPHSIAVLAFANLSNDAGQDYLSDGLAEALIDLLSRIDALRVTARTSSFYFKGRAATVEDIARKLNVGAVLEGSLRRQGMHLRIDAHLSDARTGYQLWSQSYDRTADDLLKVQDEIAAAAVQALQIKLLDQQTGRLSQGGTTNPLAFDAYLKGEQHLRTIGMQNDEALAEFSKAVALDPNFALAQGSLAFTLVMISQISGNDKEYRDMMAQARRASDRAVELAPNLGLLHAQRAMMLRNGVTDMTGAWEEANRAVALTPGNATVQQLYSLIARAVGHSAQAIEAANKGVELDPLRMDVWWSLGRVLGCAHQLDAAREAFQRAITLLGHPPGQASYELGSVLLRQGRPEEARQLCMEGTGWALQCRAIADHALGRLADAQADMAKLREMTGSGDHAAYNYSEIYAQWGQPALAMQFLASARRINDPGLSDLKCDAWLDPLRGQPGFAAIEQSLHFPPAE